MVESVIRAKYFFGLKEKDSSLVLFGSCIRYTKRTKQSSTKSGIQGKVNPWLRFILGMIQDKKGCLSGIETSPFRDRYLRTSKAPFILL